MMWLSRARLRRDTAAIGALARLLVPDGEGPRIAAAHRLVWALFADAPDRPRDFLWREEKPGHFMTLSQRPPDGSLGLFEVESKPFEPVLAPGDVLGFTLRASPAITRQTQHGQRGKRHDLVWDQLRHTPEKERAAARLEVAQAAGQAWLARQGERCGFKVQHVAADSYQPVRMPRDSGSPASFSQLDLTGRLVVKQPASFLPALAAGFGRAKAFGCGLMLIRRA